MEYRLPMGRRKVQLVPEDLMPSGKPILSERSELVVDVQLNTLLLTVIDYNKTEILKKEVIGYVNMTDWKCVAKGIT